MTFQSGRSNYSERGFSVAPVVTQRVLDSADGVLDLAGHLIGLALGLQLFVAGHLSGRLLGLAAHVFGGAFDSIVIGHRFDS